MQSSVEEVSAVLRRVQAFEPAGVAARDLSECLRLQAERQGIYEGLVAAVIDRHLDDVAESRIREIAAQEHCRPQDVQLAVDIVRQLDPKPGSSYGGDDPAYITPDVLIQKSTGNIRSFSTTIMYRICIFLRSIARQNRSMRRPESILPSA